MYVVVNVSSLCYVTRICICICMQEGVTVGLASGQIGVVFSLASDCGHTKTTVSQRCVYVYLQKNSRKFDMQKKH